MLKTSGKSIKQLSRELGCSDTSQHSWKRKYDAPLKGCLDPEKVIQLFHEHKGRYGWPRIYQQLKVQGENPRELP